MLGRTGLLILSVFLLAAPALAGSADEKCLVRDAEGNAFYVERGKIFEHSPPATGVCNQKVVLFLEGVWKEGYVCLDELPEVRIEDLRLGIEVLVSAELVDPVAREIGDPRISEWQAQRRIQDSGYYLVPIDMRHLKEGAGVGIPVSTRCRRIVSAISPEECPVLIPLDKPWKGTIAEGDLRGDLTLSMTKFIQQRQKKGHGPSGH